MKKILLICLVLLSGSAMAQIDVTFKVDMRAYNVPFTNANVNGTFNNWCGACNPMTDANNDSIWEATISLPAGTIEYKFTVDGWTGQENLTPGTTCTITTGAFTNRILTFTAATVLPVNCWGKCGECGPLGPQKLQIKLPITWQDSAATNLSTTDFGGTFSQLAPDPTEASRLALKITKGNTAELWAGTTLGTSAGFAANIPFAATSNQMQAMVYSPDAGAVFKLKAEDKADPTKSVETDATTTTANAWEVLTFNFANQSPSTAAINYTYNYNKISIFPNFGVTGATAGEKVYYVGQVAFGTVTSSAPSIKGEVLAVYPNPNNGTFVIQSPLLEDQNAIIQVKDVLGRTVTEVKGPSASNGQVKLNKLTSGMYWITLSSGNSTSSQKIIVR
ncbi:MAG TPA: T9SS type A sorting domain-containing protein [Catalimonadaceae bacterium]|nr:T9SS type A sorting domain-containing protein [Catalimonadaceae bacterium]